MKLTTCPLSILLILRVITARAYEVHDDQSETGWRPILRDRTSRYPRTNVFTPSREAAIYFSKRSKEQKRVGNEENRNMELKVSVPLDIETYTNEESPLKHDNVRQERNYNYINLERKLPLSETENNVNSSIFTSPTLQSSTKPQSPPSSLPSPSPTSFLPSELRYHDPLISYSRHATNKGDATAYYPRLNDYYGTRDSHFTDGDFNENIDPTSNSDEFKSNNLNSGNRMNKQETETKDTEKIDPIDETETKDNEKNEPIGIHLDVALKVEDKFVVDNKATDAKQHRNSKTAKGDELQTSTAYHKIYTKSDQNTVTGQVVTNDSRVVANSFNTDSSVHHSQDKILLGKRKVADIGDTFGNILQRYNINQNDYLMNYDKSRIVAPNKFNANDYYFGPSMRNYRFGYNSLNHLPVDPVMAVFLSHYGYYLPGYSGRNINYRNVYSYLASNNIHNNKPFGSYKIFSDTDI